MTIHDPASLIIDNHDPGWDTGGFIKNTSAGYLGDYAYGGNSFAPEYGRWTFSLTPGTYRVSVTWPQRPYTEATNAPFYIYDGTSASGTLLATVPVNQRNVSPQMDVFDGGVWFQDLGPLGDGGIYTVTGNKLTVMVTDVGINGLITADAVRAEYLSALHASEAGAVPSAGGLTLTEAQVAPAVQQAIANWSTTDPGAAARLSNVQVVLGQLPGTVLGLASEATSTVWLDRDGAGRGWLSGHRPSAIGHRPSWDTGLLSVAKEAGPMTGGGFDLLTVVAHELGHLLGFADLDPLAHPEALMAGRLAAGTSKMHGYARSEVQPAWHVLGTAKDAYFAELGQFASVENPSLLRLLGQNATAENDGKLVSPNLSISKADLPRGDGPLTTASPRRRSAGAQNEREECEALVDEFFDRMDEEPS